MEKREEEAAKKRAAEEAARKKQQEEAARKKQQEEAALKKQQEEAARKKREDDARKRAAEEAAKRQEREVRPHEPARLRFASSRARQRADTDRGVGVAGSGHRPDSPHVAFARARLRCMPVAVVAPRPSSRLSELCVAWSLHIAPA